MTIEQWQSALLELKSFIGSYHIEFSGGEPYLKKGFLDLVRFCRDNDIHWGVTTNGSAFGNKKIAEQTVLARPFNVNMSIDSRAGSLHDYSRGIAGSLGNITAGLANISAAKQRNGIDFPVIIKPVVHKLNFRELPDMVYWIREIGGTAISFQPVSPDTAEASSELWIEEQDMPELIAVRDKLIAMKRDGAPILNSELLLTMWPNHFRREKAPREVMPCRVGMRTYFIRADGRVEMCWNFPPIGDVKTQSAREIWYGAEGSSRRQETVQCETLCLFTCLSQKTIRDKVRMGLMSVRARN